MKVSSYFTVPLSDPTCYAPVIDYVRSMAENMQDGQNYVVLLIITDGGITGNKEKYFFFERCAKILTRDFS